MQMTLNGLAAVILCAFLFGIAVPSRADDSSPVSLPMCDSAAAKSSLKQAFETSPASKVMRVEFYDVEDAEEYRESERTRTCIGVAVTNSGRVHMKYHFRGSKNNPEQHYVEVQPIEEHVYKDLHKEVFYSTPMGKAHAECMKEANQLYYSDRHNGQSKALQAASACDEKYPGLYDRDATVEPPAFFR